MWWRRWAATSDTFPAESGATCTSEERAGFPNIRDSRYSVSMANCIECRQPIQDDLAFCPVCGADNRPPEHREPVISCMHWLMPGKPCCVLCGATFDEPAGSPPVTRHRAVIRWMLGGFVISCLLAYFLVAGHTSGLPLSIQ